MKDTDGNALHEGHLYLCNNQGQLVNHGLLGNERVDSHGEHMASKYPTYWRRLPANWRAIDTYRIDDLFPLPSSRLYHARKKLLVPGVRTGGKSLYDDVREAHATLGAWLENNKLAEQTEIVVTNKYAMGCSICHGSGKTFMPASGLSKECPCQGVIING